MPRRLPTAVLVVLLVSSCLAYGFEAPSPLPERRLVILGLDAATWTVLQPMMKQGRLPYWQRLLAESAAAPLETYEPTASLLIWTTVVTGRTPEDHGLNAWTSQENDQLTITSNLRKTEALWTLFPKYGRSSIFHNWWGSWPSEQTKGAIVSRRFYLPDEEHRAWPGRLVPALEQAVDKPLFQGFLFYDALAGQLAYRLQDWIFPDMPALLQNNLVTLSNWVAFDRAVVEAGCRTLERFAPDLTGIFVRGLDPVEHIFWRFLEPEGFSVPPEQLAAFREVIPRYYAFYERLVFQVIAAMGPQTSLIILSDHGMYSRDRERPKVMGAPPVRIRRDLGDRVMMNFGVHNTAPEGIVLFWGPLFGEGRLSRPVSVYDICPTVLAAFGMAVARDMQGRVVEEAFAPGALPPIERIATYETGSREQRPTPAPSEADQRIREELESLGYLGK
jgi:hypothetical protein